MICDRKNDREIAKNIATDRFNIQFFFFGKEDNVNSYCIIWQKNIRYCK